MRNFHSPFSRVPEVQLLSNGRYSVVISNAGGGYSNWRDLSITRWREDPTRDCWGNFLYLREVETGEFWSAAYQPTLRLGEGYEVNFEAGHAEISQRHSEIESRLEICLPPGDDLELRRITLTNHSERRRMIELTSYAEVVFASAGADAAHPAFSNLFVQTEFLPERSALLCTRRPRSEAEKTAWLVHSIGESSAGEESLSCETDRARFLGRGRSANDPLVMRELAPLSNTVGSVLDPIVSLRRKFQIGPGETIHVHFLLGAAENREGALALAGKYALPEAVSAAFAATRLLVPGSKEDLYQRLAGALIYSDPARRSAAEVLLKNRLGQRALWSFGLSGDLPIAVLQISQANPEQVKRLIEAHTFWRKKGLATDLIFLIRGDQTIRKSLQEETTQLITSLAGPETLNKGAGIFVLDQEQLGPEASVLLQSAARLSLNDTVDFEQPPLPERNAVLPVHARKLPAPFAEPVSSNRPKLLFENGFGGFIPDGSEYVITLQAGQVTPAPWVNVLANPEFGTVISESGSSYSWAGNSHEYRLTPWSNDPIADPSGEAFYIKDEQSGRFWSPTPGPARGSSSYVIRHGFGYTVFEHSEEGLFSELTIFVATDAPVKVALLKVRNDSGGPRRITLIGYWEWVLGDLRPKNGLHVQTQIDDQSQALLARNFYNTDFPEFTVFLDVNNPERTITGDRTEFLGRNGDLSHPAAMNGSSFTGRTGVGLDPCGAIRVTLDLDPGQERETNFFLGAGQNRAAAEELIKRFRSPEEAGKSLLAVKHYWKKTLHTVQVETPDPAVNLMANGWLLYQTLACRLWGRTGFYQSGGAFGFRDQLQDVMALVHAEPALTRHQLLLAAAHQFEEGDVLHWWHPPAGRGVRTHVSDDYLWLPYVTWRYVSCLGDLEILDEKVTFLVGPTLPLEQESTYDLPGRSKESATLYEHCVRAIKNGLKFGSHGLPLMGGGDWNDGMNLVGKEGRGESVWLGFFLYEVVTRFAEVARNRNDSEFADLCLNQAAQLQVNLEQHAWDGEWYRRAYFDNGEPLGSHLNTECQIDSISQSWSVISRAGNAARTKSAMESVAKRLVRREAGLIQLLDPPFDRSALHPGYIQGYVPGVRENGGQYTHAAVWATTAFALLGDHERAWELASLLNPIHHGATSDRVTIYKVEPYVIAADIYAVSPHTGRGGWTWYTGSAGWMYRLLTETLLGLNREGNHLKFIPRPPKSWTQYRISYRYGNTPYQITLSKLARDSTRAGRTFLDQVEIKGDIIPLVDDGQTHQVELGWID